MIARNAAVAAVMDVSAGEEAEDEVAVPTCKSAHSGGETPISC